MARKLPTPLPPKVAELSAENVRRGIRKLNRRLEELRDLTSQAFYETTPELTSVRMRLDSTLVEIFGPDTVDYERYKVNGLYAGSAYINPQPNLVSAGYAKGINKAIATVESAIVALEERLEDADEAPAERIARAFEGLDLHPEIERAAGQLYRDGYYANAIEDGCKALNQFVRLRSGVDDKDGVALMQHVFSEKSPVLAFNALADQSDRSEHIGLLNLFAGAISALRNPRAHKIIKDDPERALEYIAFISLLAKIVDDARRV